MLKRVKKTKLNKHYLNHDKAFEIASKYKKLKDFIANEKITYDWLRRHAHLDDVCVHMARERHPISYAEVLKSAKACASRMAFMNNYPAHYYWACRKNMLNEVCAHMPRKSQPKKTENNSLTPA